MIESISGFQALPIPMAVTPAATAVKAAASAVNAASVANAASGAAGASVTDFPKLLLDSVQGLNDAQVSAGQQVTGFLNGRGPDLHTLMLNMEQAGLSLELAVQVRNKLLDAYNEIMRMQV